MRAAKCYFLLIFILLTMLPAPQAAAQGPHQSVGLVLSGGGARGIAHAGLLKALEENDIPIDYITGTSMGAIVGGLYACGYTPEEIMALFTSEYFSYMSTGTTDPSMVYYFTRPDESPQFFTFPLGKSKATPVYNPQSLINPMPMDFGFMEILSPFTAQCDSNFNRLMVPFRCVASDVRARHKKVLSGGSLGHSIHASMSFPLIFQATMIDSTMLYDGGIYDNFPVDVMRTDFAPDIMIGCVVRGRQSDDLNSYMSQLDLLVTEPQSYALPADEGIKVVVNLEDFTLLDFPRAKAIYDQGYRTAMAMMDSIKSRVTTRMPAQARALRRAMFKSATPYLRFDTVTVSGGTPRQNEYLQYLFSPAKGCDTIGVDRARRAFYRAVSSGEYSVLRPEATYDDSTGLFGLEMTTRLKSRFGAAAGAYITSTDNSMLYGRLQYRSLSFRSINSSIEAWIGQSYMAGVFKGRLYLHWALPSSVTFTAAAIRRRYHNNDRLFFENSGPAELSAHQYYSKLTFAVAAGRTGAVEIGAGAARLYNSFLADFGATDNKARNGLYSDLGMAYAAYRTTTFDNVNYPTSGTAVNASVAAVGGRVNFDNEGHDLTRRRFWLQGSADVRSYLPLSRRFAMGLEAYARLSSRPLTGNYYASLSSAPAFTPTPASDAAFRPSLRADSYVAAGLVPVYMPMSNLSVRLNAYCFVPMRRIMGGPGGSEHFSRWFPSAYFYGEMAANYKLPFANISGWVNYESHRNHISGGISLGFYILAPNFLN